MTLIEEFREYWREEGRENCSNYGGPVVAAETAFMAGAETILNRLRDGDVVDEQSSREPHGERNTVVQIEQDMVKAFHEKLGRPYEDKPVYPCPEDAITRLRLMQEELAELAAAIDRKDMVDTADALADLLYVVLGTACTCGIDIAPVFHEVHRSNMTKQPRLDGGKIVKGPEFKPPNIRDILFKQMEKPAV